MPFRCADLMHLTLVTLLLASAQAKASPYGQPLTLGKPDQLSTQPPLPFSSPGLPLTLGDTQTNMLQSHPSWLLKQGAFLHEELARWASMADWTLFWEPGITWQVAADTHFSGTIADAIEQVIEGLYLEGRPVRLVL